ncbi:MAG: hypothetical protein ABTD50_20545 [Polyangiaceae bacterium]|jgi:hypothetical protein
MASRSVLLGAPSMDFTSGMRASSILLYGEVPVHRHELGCGPVSERIDEPE